MSKYNVYALSQGSKETKWVKAGVAWANRDGSLNVYLDVLPLDGKLHIREVGVDMPPPANKEDGK